MNVKQKKIKSPPINKCKVKYWGYTYLRNTNSKESLDWFDREPVFESEACGKAPGGHGVTEAGVDQEGDLGVQPRHLRSVEAHHGVWVCGLEGESRYWIVEV